MSLVANRMEADKRTTEEEAATLRRCEIAERLVARLLEAEPEQLQLFEIEKDRETARLHDKSMRSLRERNPGRLVVEAAIVQAYRYEAAMYGAGFHPSQFDEITWQDNELAGLDTVYLDFLGGWHVRHQPARVGRPNKMRDEVNEELFAELVPTTEYSFSDRVYITSEEDLVKIFEFDQSNLAGCRWLDNDLLYEREN